MIDNQMYEINPSLLSLFETDRCILCLNEPERLTHEHIIPKSIGGIFKPKILCNNCNNTIGSKIHSELVNNMSIQIAMQNLAENLPELFKKFEHRFEYVGVTESGIRTPMKMDKNGKLKTKSIIKPDDSIICGINDAPKHLVNIFNKTGYSQSEISKLIEEYKIAPNGKRIHLTTDLEFQKNKYDKTERYPKGKEFSPKVSLIIIYEFLALILGEKIKDKIFNDIRDCLLNEIEIPETIKIEDFFNQDNYLPIHQIEFYYDEQENCVFGVVIFFNWLVYTVHFTMLQNLECYPKFIFDLKGNKIFFTYDLETGNV